MSPRNPLRHFIYRQNPVTTVTIVPNSAPRQCKTDIGTFASIARGREKWLFIARINSPSKIEGKSDSPIRQ
jgi:hypothetical protein